MTKRFPYFKWYPADAISDIKYASLSMDELGFFHACLNYAWINDGLPADPAKLAKLFKIDQRRFTRFWTKVRPMFVEVEGTFKNLRQEVERNSAAQKSQMASESAKVRHKRAANAHRSDIYSDSDSDKDADAVQQHTAAATASRAREAETPPPKSPQQQQPRTRFQEKFPKTAEAIRESFPDADDVFVMKLASASVECTRCVNGAPLLEDPTDAMIADAVRHCRRDKQTSAGLFLSTVPQCVKTWCTSGRTAVVERKQPATAMDRARILWKQREKEKGHGAD